MNIPGNLPLSIDGKMDCRTCHSAHSTGDPKEEGVEKSVFLRVENNNSELCKACHTDIGSTKMGITHPMTPVKENTSSVSKKIHELNGKLGTNNEVICQSCHTPHSPKEEKLLINHRNHSELCATCHTTMVSNKDSEYLKGMLNHPINIEHENLEKVNKIKKEGGSYGLNNEVICLTCHSVHKAKTDTLLYRKNSDNSLCFVCHETQNTILETKHDMKTIKGFRTKDGKTAQEKGTCESCHDPHGWSLQLPKTDDDMITKHDAF
jgi:predicted CXXCH cytochrome family protein